MRDNSNFDVQKSGRREKETVPKPSQLSPVHLNWNQTSVSQHKTNIATTTAFTFRADSTIDAHCALYDCVECVCFGCQNKCKHYDLRR